MDDGKCINPTLARRLEECHEDVSRRQGSDSVVLGPFRGGMSKLVPRVSSSDLEASLRYSLRESSRGIR
jgi:hypothetical protein